MPYNARDPNADAGTAAWQQPHARTLACVVLAALVILIALRHFGGTVAVSAGTS